MLILTMLLLSLGVATDAFAVSITNGLSFSNFRKKEIILTSITFGFFQGIMPLLGYQIGHVFFHKILYLDHWIVLFILLAIGFNMIIEGFHSLKNKNELYRGNTFTYKILLAQGIATSIDAMALGVSFAVLDTNIIVATFCISIITFLLCIIGGILGKKFSTFLQEKTQLFGGFILILIGIRIFLSHI